MGENWFVPLRDFVSPFLGFAVLVTLGMLAWCVWTYVTHPEADLAHMSRRGRIVWRVGLGVVVASISVAAGLVAWALGRWIVGR